MPPKGEGFESGFTHVTRGQPLYQADYRELTGTLKAGETKNFKTRVFAGAKEVDVIDGYQVQPADHRFLQADRLGMVRHHHPADVPADGLPLQVFRQFRPGHSRHDRHRQAAVLPDRQSPICVHGQDEDAAAEDGGAEGQARRRQDGAADRR